MSTPTAIKISGELAALARTKAEQADRSLTGQIEHWAKLGQALDALLPTPVAAALKRSQGALDAIEDPTLRERILAAFSAFQALSPAQKRQQIGLDAMVRLEPDPAHPGGYIRISPDGTRTAGTLEGRAFGAGDG